MSVLNGVVLFVLCAFSVAFAFVGWISGAFSSPRDKMGDKGVELPFKVFLALYAKAPDRWICLKGSARYGDKQVFFPSAHEWRKYNRWRKRRKKLQEKEDEEKRKDEFLEGILREYEPKMPPPPTIGTNVIELKPPIIYGRTNGKRLYLELIKEAERQEMARLKKENEKKPKPNITIPKFEFEGVDEIVTEIKREFARLKAENEKKQNQNITIPKFETKEFDEEIAEKLQEMARIRNGENRKQDDEIVCIDGAKLVPQPAEFCGDCPWAYGNYPDVAICGIDHHAHLRSEWCKYRKQAALKPTKTVREGACGKCRYFGKHDKPPFGYCVRNDEITDEAYVKLCFEPIPPVAHKHPEPLGTVTTH